MRKTFVLVLAFVLFGAGSGAAQSVAARPASHTAAARELLEQMNLRESIDSTIATMLRVQTEGNATLAPFKEVMREFLRKHMSWEAMRDQYVEIYANAFTEPELREMTAFYRTPTGRKMASLMPSLSRQGAALGERAVREHAPELERMIMERMEEMRREGGGTRP